MVGGQMPVRQTPTATSLPGGTRREVVSFQMFRILARRRRTRRACMSATLRGTLPRLGRDEETAL